MRTEQLLKDLNKEYTSIDVHDNEACIEQYNIRNIPTVIKVDDNGNEVSRLSGAQCMNKQLLEQL